MNKNLALAIQITANSRQADQQMAKMGGSMARMHDRFAKMNNAREALGIRSERAIQREIKQTEAAYNRLQRSGQAGAREMGRAYDAMRSKVKGLRQEMEGVTRTQKAWGMAKTGAVIGGGALAGAYALAQPVKKVMAYDRAVAMASNTIYSDRDVAGRIAGKSDINAAVETAVRVGGGDRDGALAALSSLAGRGTMGSVGNSFEALKTIQKYQTGTGAESETLVDLTDKAKAFGIGLKDLSYAMDMAISGGNDGGMELGDLAKWLPAQMANAKRVGMSGTKDYAKLVALNEVAFLGAGTKDEAGNNVRNLSAKLSSQDTRKDLSRAGGFNLDAELIKGREKGLDAFDVMADLTRKVMAKNKNYRALQKKLAATSDKDKDGRRQILEAQAEIINGSAIGKVMGDQQAGAALAAIMAFGDKAKLIQENALKNRGLGEKNFGTIAATDDYQAERLKNEAEFAQKRALEGLTKIVGDVSGKLANYAQQYPGLATALAGASTALTTLAAAGMGAAGTSLLAGGGAGATTGALGGATATGVAAKWGARLLPKLAKVGGGLGMMVDSKELGTDSDGNQLDTMEGMKASMLKRAPNLANARKSLAESNAAYARKFDMSGKLKVEVDVKNNTATVTPAFKDREVQARVDTGRTMPTVTAGIRG